MSEKSKSEELAQKAIKALETAGKFDDKKQYSKAIEKYEEAIKFLTQSGYLPHRIKDIKERIAELKKIQEEKTAHLKVEKQAETDQIQIKAFSLLEQANTFEKKGVFDNAIKRYNTAIPLLKEVGWSNEQISSLKQKITKLEKDKEKQQKIKVKQDIQYRRQVHDPVKSKISVAPLKTTVGGQKISDRAKKFQEKKKKEQEIQEKAFDLINKGKSLEKKQKYDSAIKNLENAIDLFKEIQWDSYISSIQNLIDDFKQKQKRLEKSRQVKQKRDSELISIQRSIQEKQQQDLIESKKRRQDRKKQIEEKKRIAQQSEEKFFQMLDKADKLVEEQNFEQAKETYNSALKMIEELGVGWETYRPRIEETIKSVERKEELHLEKSYQFQKKKEKELSEKEELQGIISERLKKEQIKLKQKEVAFKEKSEELKDREKKKERAFKFLDKAQEYIISGDYDKAIYAYQNAGNLFAEIQWEDELQHIETAIEELEKKKDEQIDLKQKRMEKKIKKLKEQEEFQKRITQQLEKERQKLRNKELTLRERENELEYQNKQKQEAFKSLDRAQTHIQEGDYEKAISLYRKAINIFSDIQWSEEIPILEDSITELENERRRALKRKQEEFQRQLKQEQEKREFHSSITKEMNKKREDLKRKEIKLREREQELEYRENKRKEAFKLLDQAQELFTLGKFDEALEIYHEVANIFAQIQWTEEIPVIEEAIKIIKMKKEQLKLWRKKTREKRIKEEVKHQQFMESLQKEKEKVKNRELEQRKEIEKQKKLSQEALKQQSLAFNLLEEGDVYLNKERYEDALLKYEEAIRILSQIGWEGNYLKLLIETKDFIKEKIQETKSLREQEVQKAKEREKQNEEFNQKVENLLDQEKGRLKEKELKLKEQKLLKQEQIEVREKAFTHLDLADELLNGGKYDDALEKYQKVRLLLNQINFPTELIEETIHKVSQKKIEEEKAKQEELELKFERKEQRKLMEERIAQEMKKEQERLRKKKIEKKRKERFEQEVENKRKIAFNMLDNAQNKIENEEYKEAKNIYFKIIEIFKEIQWDDEIEIIEKSISEIEKKQKETELKKVKEAQEIARQKKENEVFRKRIAKEMEQKKIEMQQKEELAKKQQIELKNLEQRKKIAFDLLDQAQSYISEGKYDDAIKTYHDITNIFAEIQWKEEIPRIQEAIKEIRQEKEEEKERKRVKLQKRIEKEAENKRFIERIREQRNIQKAQEQALKEFQEKKEKLSEINKTKQEDAFKYIEEADELLNQQNFDDAIQNYKQAISLLTEIGWEGNYLKLIKETLKDIVNRKNEFEQRKTLELEKQKKQQLEQLEFQNRITEQHEKENARLQEKQIEIRKMERMQQEKENLRKEAFALMDKAEGQFIKGEFSEAIQLYREAELILSEIQYPIDTIEEMILKIREKQKEEELNKQKIFEKNLRKQEEKEMLQEMIAEKARKDKKRLLEKNEKLERRENLIKYIEAKKERAFSFLEQAEELIKDEKFNEALELYHQTEKIFHEIQFPTNTIQELILNLEEKRRQKEFEEQRELESQIKKEKEIRTFQKQVAKNLQKEKERLREKQIKIREHKERKEIIEKKKQEAFKILDEAEYAVQRTDFEQAISKYRKAQMILRQIQFPTDSVEEMIQKIIIAKKRERKEKELEFQRELKRLNQEKEMQKLVKERKREEEERKKAKQLALNERKKLIEKQESYRDAAYNLLQKAQKYINSERPEFDKAISLYFQARNVLAENIGWEPEIQNIDRLISNLEQEKAEYFRRKAKIEQEERRKQREYEDFQKELKKRTIEAQRQRFVKQKEVLYKTKQKQKLEDLQSAALEYIEQGKKLASYHRFNKAYKMFENAKHTFRLIGWDYQIELIEREIEKAKELERNAEQEELEELRRKEQLEVQKVMEEKVKEQQEKKLQAAVGEVGNLAADVTSLLKKQQEKVKLDKLRKVEKVKKEAHEFGKSMGKMIRLKQELMDEIRKAKEQKEKEAKKRELEKERKEVDDIKKMLREASKNKKK
ncbi:MAG: tetratricopeptide repeat protein [Candidatus Lokiarchaeota archaeon]|nr:tetratricopeptide repeat protein [Candidatus Lokiarchaeota archaeon]